MAAVFIASEVIFFEIPTSFKIGSNAITNNTIPVIPAPRSALLERVRINEMSAAIIGIIRNRCSFFESYPFSVLVITEMSSNTPKIKTTSKEYIPLKFTSPKNQGARITLGLYENF